MKERVRQPFFVVDTPVPSAPKVVCYQDTYELHIPADRKMPGLIAAAKTGLITPSCVVTGTSAPGHLVFINQNFTSQTSNHPLVIIVDPDGNPMPVVATMGFRRDFKDLSIHTVVWEPEEQ